MTTLDLLARGFIVFVAIGLAYFLTKAWLDGHRHF